MCPGESGKTSPSGCMASLQGWALKPLTVAKILMPQNCKESEGCSTKDLTEKGGYLQNHSITSWKLNTSSTSGAT